MIRLSIGQRIKSMRTQQGMSIDELAYKLGKNRTTIYRYENGDIENLPLSILDCLADALNTTPAFLMGWADNNNNDVNDNNGGLTMKHIEMWCEEFPNETFTLEEFRKIVEYARFVISMRNK